MKNLPRHIAIIMDGNGRWAKEQGLSRAEGHRRGAQTIERIVQAAHDRNIRFLTLYAFSEENWNRPSDEVLSLMQLLRHFVASKRAELIEKRTRFMAIGDLERLAPEVRRELIETSEATAAGDRMTLVVALSYGSRQEIVRAVNSLMRSGVSEVTPEAIDGALDTAGIPDPDLLIRTSGEYRISNFLLWQIAYSELYFTETLWPEFTEAEFDRAIDSYSDRERRFGQISEQLTK
ncbi:MAG TPA: polyprenyl diphosphate synthase [bacterium]|nr:polyprenyl diphosphate synthase [bacterium]